MRRTETGVRFTAQKFSTEMGLFPQKWASYPQIDGLKFAVIRVA
jgi:hypothetical protein